MAEKGEVSIEFEVETLSLPASLAAEIREGEVQCQLRLGETVESSSFVKPSDVSIRWSEVLTFRHLAVDLSSVRVLFQHRASKSAKRVRPLVDRWIIMPLPPLSKKMLNSRRKAEVGISSPHGRLTLSIAVTYRPCNDPSGASGDTSTRGGPAVAAGHSRRSTEMRPSVTPPASDTGGISPARVEQLVKLHKYFTRYRWARVRVGDLEAYAMKELGWKRAECRKFFEACDKDGDGTLTKVEICRGAFEALGDPARPYEASAAQIAVIFDYFDADGSGELDSEVMSAILKRLLAAHSHASDEEVEDEVATMVSQMFSDARLLTPSTLVPGTYVITQDGFGALVKTPSYRWIIQYFASVLLEEGPPRSVRLVCFYAMYLCGPPRTCKYVPSSACYYMLLYIPISVTMCSYVRVYEPISAPQDVRLLRSRDI